ncbi:MAG: polysaccharide biosynthesis/export family protein [bacterium]|nr:polysaccharide biosynthesis/export family protein [bacterium]
MNNIFRNKIMLALLFSFFFFLNLFFLNNLKAEDYTLKIGDIIEISVWEHRDLSRTLTIRPDGKISFPLIDEIFAAGLTSKKLDDVITENLSKFFPNPKVTVIIQKFQNNQIFVLGQVNRPGPYILDHKIKVLEAISLAGGFLPNADLKKAVVFRENIGVLPINLFSLLNLKKLEYNIFLSPNDTIYIPDNNANFVYVIGEINAPGIYQITDNLTLLKAITLAGGPKKSAILQSVKLIRQSPNGPMITNVNLKNLTSKPEDIQEIFLNPGDIVYLPPTKLAKFNNALEQLMPLFTALFYTTGTTYNIREIRK